MERNKESQNAALLDLQNEMKSLKSLFISRASSNALEQQAPITPSYTTSLPTTPVVPTEGLSSRLSATINGSGARAGIPSWQMAAPQTSSANNTTAPAAETEVNTSK